QGNAANATLAFACRKSSRWLNRFFPANNNFHFKYEAYLEGLETSNLLLVFEYFSSCTILP
ncbi:MAG: hypothetical protein WBK65_08435, partial [Thermotogota bacterium]